MDNILSKIHYHTCNNTLAGNVMSLAMTVSAMHFIIEIIFILNKIKSHFKGLYDTQYLTLIVISYNVYETS